MRKGLYYGAAYKFPEQVQSLCSIIKIKWMRVRFFC